MDKDRIEGVGHEAKGAVKSTAGKITGDQKLHAEGEVERLTGKAQNKLGQAKDAVRDAAGN